MIESDENQEDQPIIEYHREGNVKKENEHVAFLSIIVNLINVGIGAGILTLSYVMSLCGLALGMIMLIVVAIVSVYTLLLLTHMAYEYKVFTFRDLARKAFPGRLGRVVGFFFEACIFFQGYSVLIGYIIIVAEYCSLQIRAFVDDEKVIFIIISHPILWMILVTTFLMFPLSLLKNMRMLSYTSSVSLFCIFFVVAVVAIELFRKDNIPDGIKAFGIRDFSDFFVSLPLTLFSFASHNAIFPLIAETRKKLSKKKTQFAIVIAVSIVLFAYLVMATCGYLQFSTSTPDNLLKAFDDPANVQAILSRIAVSFIIIVSYPLFLFTARNALEKELFSKYEFNWIRWIIITAAMSFSALFLAASVPFISVVFGFSGAVFGVLVGFIFPLVSHMMLTKHLCIRIFNFIFLIVASFVGFLSIVGVFIDLFRETKNRDIKVE